MAACNRKPCTRSTEHISGYCSDTCLQLDCDPEATPVLVLARNKAGGFGTNAGLRMRQPVFVPDVT